MRSRYKHAATKWWIGIIQRFGLTAEQGLELLDALEGAPPRTVPKNTRDALKEVEAFYADWKPGADIITTKEAVL